MTEYQYLAHDELHPEQPLVITSGTLPEPKSNQVVIKVEAAGLNRADLMQRQGNYPPPAGASTVMGLEVAGTVVKGDASERWLVGDQVMALVPGGGYASHAIAEAAEVMALPTGYDFRQAAGVPEAFLTAYQALFIEGGCHSGQYILIHGGAGGVGSAAVQLAREAGLTVLATAGSEAKCQVIRELGATAINYREEDIASVIKEQTQGHGVDFILDGIAGQDYTDLHLQCTALDATIVVLSMLAGRYGQLDYGQVLMKRLTIKGSTLRNRNAVYKANLVDQFGKQFGAALSAGTIAPVMDKRVFTWQQADEAQQRLDASEHIGKIVLSGEWPAR